MCSENSKVIDKETRDEMAIEMKKLNEPLKNNA